MSDYLKPNNDDFHLGSDDFTMDFWVKFKKPSKFYLWLKRTVCKVMRHQFHPDLGCGECRKIWRKFEKVKVDFDIKESKS